MKCFYLINVILWGCDYAVVHFELNQYVNFVSRPLFKVMRQAV